MPRKLTRAEAAAFAERLERLLWSLPTYGQKEAAAGVTDRAAFWQGKTEEQARAALREMIAERLRAGLIRAPGDGKPADVGGMPAATWNNVNRSDGG